MKTYGSAVLIALQAQHKSIDEIGKLIDHRRFKAFLDGGNPVEWLDCFWQQMAILEAQRINTKSLFFMTLYTQNDYGNF